MCYCKSPSELRGDEHTVYNIICTQLQNIIYTVHMKFVECR